MLNKAVTFAKHRTPDKYRVQIRRVQQQTHNARLRLTVPVKSRSGFGNIYHTAVRKTASQWITAMFSDPIAYRWSGLLPYVPRYYAWRHPQPFPTGHVALSLFIAHDKFATLPKPARYRAFFVMRDPRDMAVSSYFSTRNSHAPMGDIPKQREILRDKSPKEGLLHTVRHLSKRGTFRDLRSWADAAAGDEVQLFKYEDLTGERQSEVVGQLFRHCGIDMPGAELTALLDKYSFARMRRSRESGAATSHYRKGSAGDWRNHFDDDIYQAFVEETGDLVEVLGYPSRDQHATSGG